MGASTNAPTSQFIENARNQQISYSLDGATLASYTYNPDGLRRSKHVLLTLEQRYIWSGDSMVYECELLYPNNGTVYVYGINLIWARNSSDDDTFYLYNAHGDVVQLVDGNGTIIQNYSYDAFGVEYDSDPADTNPFRYCGEYFDTETGTIYLRARYYDPATGRFTSEDPIGAGLNWYTYCNCNPISYIDPFGLDAILLYDDADMGHTALLVQYDGAWYYFFYGANAVLWIYVGTELPASLDDFNATRIGGRTYTDSIYFKGDYSKTAEYCSALADEYCLESTSNNDPINKGYNVFYHNCAVVGLSALYKAKDFVYVAPYILAYFIPRDLFRNLKRTYRVWGNSSWYTPKTMAGGGGGGSNKMEEQKQFAWSEHSIITLPHYVINSTNVEQLPFNHWGNNVIYIYA